MIEPLQFSLDDWARSRSVQYKNYPDQFAQILSERFRARLIPGTKSTQCLAWTTDRPVPGVGREHRTVVIVVETGTSPPDRILEEIKSLVKPSDVALVFALGECDALLQLARRSILAILLLDQQSADRLLASEDDVDRLLRKAILRDASDGLLAQLNPYWTQGPVTGSMFVGRVLERGKILSATGKGVAVIGPRGIGKSSLLLFTERNVPDNAVAVYVNCEVEMNPSVVVSHVMQRLYPQSFAADVRYGLEEMPRHTSRKIFVLLDEADSLVSYCDRNKLESFYGQLKGFTARGGKLVMAGYRQFRDAVLNPTHSLYQTMERLRLEPFGERDPGARELIVNPMEERGITYWNDDTAVSRIMDWSSGHPLYIQLYCQRLAELCVAHRNSSIDWQLMDSVERDDRIYHHVLDTFNHTTNALEKCVAYAATAQPADFDEAHIFEVLSKKWGLAVPFTRVQDACETLVLANVLAKRDVSYSFLLRALPQLLRARAPVDRIMPYLIQEANRAPAD